jgi:hypothetical protein
VGTPVTELFIGVVGQFSDMDPASLTTDFIGWEIKNNTMSGLYRFNADSQLEPLLASALPSGLRRQAGVHHPAAGRAALSRWQ